MSKPPMVFDPASHTGAGRSKRRPPPRPGKDSLPKHECAVDGCGVVGHVVTVPMHQYLVTGWGGIYVPFCSLGCLGRWAALQEVRQ